MAACRDCQILEDKTPDTLKHFPVIITVENGIDHIQNIAITNILYCSSNPQLLHLP